MRILLVILAVLVPAYSARAQTGYPMLMSIKPVAAAVGQVSEHVINSRYNMFGTYQVIVSGSGVAGEAVLPEPKDGKTPDNLTSLTVRFTVAADALPGVRQVRVATRQGVSTVGQLVIVNDPVVRESTSNNTIKDADPFEIPATICGCIEANEDIDLFRFEALAGQKLTFHTRCMRLQDRIHDLQQHANPILTLRNSAGSTVATADNELFGDPLLSCEIPADGAYFLEVRDVRYQGNKYWEYSIEVSEQPYVLTSFPVAIQSDSPEPCELIGTNLPAGAAERQGIPTDRVRYSTNREQRVFTWQGQTTNPVARLRTHLPVVLETHPEQTEAVQQIVLPTMINGRISAAGEVDRYRFTAAKGDRISLQVHARRFQSELDSIIRILDATGRARIENDDLSRYKHTFADSAIENWTVPEDGEYTIEIRDLHLRGGRQFVYAIETSAAEPGFELYLDTDKTRLTPGTSAVIFANAVRKNGFEGEINLEIDGLPAGVEATCGRILSGRRDAAIVLTADPECEISVAPVTIRGTAAKESSDKADAIAVTAIPYQETYQPGGGRGHWPVEDHVVSVADPTDILAVRVSASEILLKPGEKVQIDVELERAEGFTANVQLDLLYRHLNSVYADPLPAGISIDSKNSKTLLTAKESKGHITLIAAKDAAAAQSIPCAVMANVSLNFVMKASYCSDPIQVSVAP